MAWVALVGARLIDEAGPVGPDVLLVVQRDVAEVVGGDLYRLLQQLVADLFLEGNLRLADTNVDPRVAVAAAVDVPQAGFPVLAGVAALKLGQPVTGVRARAIEEQAEGRESLRVALARLG